MLSLSRSGPPSLLVSVRNAEEALAAVAGGADLVDVKEPARGALGRADEDVVASVVEAVRRVAPGVPTSAALGELAEDGATRFRSPRGLDLVKVGLAGMADRPDWPGRLRRWSADRPAWVGVVYSDWQVARAPRPDDVVERSLELGAAGVLFDTFDKSGGSLLEILDESELAATVAEIHRQSRFVALAGRVGLADLPRLGRLGPDVVAVRSAACVGGDRGAEVDEEAVRRLRSALSDSTKAGAVGLGSKRETSRSRP